MQSQQNLTIQLSLRDKIVEFLARLSALLLSAITTNSLRIYIAAENKESGNILSASVILAFCTLCFLGVNALIFGAFWLTRNKENKIPLPVMSVAFFSTFSTTLGYTSATTTLISIGNKQYNDARIDACFAAAGLFLLMATVLAQHRYQIETKIPLLDILTCKYFPQRREFAAAANASNAILLSCMSIFAFQRNDSGSSIAESIGCVTSVGLCAKTLYCATQDAEHMFSKLTFSKTVLLYSGFGFLIDALISDMNGRGKTQCLFETISGCMLFLGGLLCAWYQHRQTQSQTTQPIPQDMSVIREETSTPSSLTMSV